MVETYAAHQTRLYYVEETTYGQIPATPAMVSVPAESVEPAFNPNNIKLRGIGSRDLQAIKKGLRAPSIKVTYPLPSDAPIHFLQYADLDKSLSVETIYYKGTWASATDIIALDAVGCKVNQATVGCSIEDVVKATAELIGQLLYRTTTKIAGATYTDKLGAVPFNESYVKKGVATLDRVTDWQFTISNNLKPVPVIRNDFKLYLLKYLVQRHRALTGQLTFEFESKEEYDDVCNDTEFTLEFGLGGTNKAVFSGCKWENVATPARVEDLVALKASFVAKSLTIS